MKSYNVVALAGAALVFAAVVLVACPTTGVVCSSYVKPCGQSCADVQNDPKNCGACQLACQSGQVCQAGHCLCQPGSVQCGGQCVVTSSDPNNCGACASAGGSVCSADGGQVCENGQCKAGCTLGGNNGCNGACVSFENDPNNCGGCGQVCPPKESCHAGACRFDVLFSCASLPGVAGLNATSLQVGPFTGLGTAPQALDVLQGTLLDLDGSDDRIYEADLVSLAQFREAPYVQTFPSHLLVDGANVYVVNNGTGNLQVLSAGSGALDAGDYVATGVDGGLGLHTVAVQSIAAANDPEYMTKLGSSLYVSLFASGKVARVDVTNPAAPSVVATYDFNGLNLHLFDGGAPGPKPWGITSFQGKVYVALENNYYNPTTGALAASGDGLLAVIDPADGGVAAVDLGSDLCLEANWLAPSVDGSLLYVSCAGQVRTTGAPHFNTTGVDRAAVLLLDRSNQRVSSWTCPEGGADGGCNTFSPNVFAVRGSRVYVGDTAYGRALVLDTVGGKLVEVAGFADGGIPLTVCPVNLVTGNANVSDVLSVP